MNAIRIKSQMERDKFNLKKSFILLSLIISVLSLSLYGSIKKKEKRIVENVSVVNVEVPVRVFYKGKPIDELKKGDFKLYEDGKLQKINGFWIKRKSITIIVDDLKENSEIIQKRKESSRYFVLVFRTTKLNKSLREGVTYIFEKVLRERDRLMIFVNNRTFILDNLKGKKRILELVLKMISKESKKARMRQVTEVEKIKTIIYRMRSELASGGGRSNPADEVRKMLGDYLKLWNEYKRRYLTPSINGYYNFAQYLDRIKGEKWVVNFYQMELFPRLKPTGEIVNYVKNLINNLRISDRGEDISYAQILSSLLVRINLSLNVSQDFPTKQISKLFYKVGAVFQTIFIKTQNSLLSNDIEYKRVSTDIENNFRELTRITGGDLISSNNIKKSLDKIVKKKDILYMLTYSPSDDKKGKIKVVTSDEKYRVVFDNNIRQDYIKNYFKKMEKKIPAVKILNAVFNQKKLKISINGFYLRKEGEKKLGKLKIHIKITDGFGNVRFDNEKILVSENRIFSISINFPKFKEGEYSCVISVIDLLTDKSDMKYITSETN